MEEKVVFKISFRRTHGDAGVLSPGNGLIMVSVGPHKHAGTLSWDSQWSTWEHTSMQERGHILWTLRSHRRYDFTH